MGSDDYQPDRLTFKTFLKLYIRSFFIQGSFSVKYRQNTGFAFCMEPVGKVLWNEPQKQREFLIRHLEYYNGNPFMITLVLGAVAKMEEMLKNGTGITESNISGFKKAVGAATGSVGDRFFWTTLRPFGIIFGLLSAFFYGLWGVLIVLAVFNIPNFILRWHWLKTGYRLGTGVFTEIKSKKLQRAIQIMENISAGLLAFLAAVLVVVPDLSFNRISVAAAVLFVVSLILFKCAVRVSVVLLISLGFAVITGIIFTQVLY